MRMHGLLTTLVLLMVAASWALAQSGPPAGPPQVQGPMMMQGPGMQGPMMQGPGMMQGPMMPMMQGAPPPMAMLPLEGMLYIVLGNMLYKVDPREMSLLGVVFLPPGPPGGQPGMRGGMPGMPPGPPPEPPGPPPAG